MKQSPEKHLAPQDAKSPIQVTNKAQSAPFFLAASAGLLLMGASCQGAGAAPAMAVPVNYAVITTTSNLISVHDFDSDGDAVSPPRTRLDNLGMAAPSLYSSGSRQIVVQPLVQSSFSSGSSHPRYAQAAPANGPAATGAAPAEPPAALAPGAPPPAAAPGAAAPAGPTPPQVAPPAAAPVTPPAAETPVTPGNVPDDFEGRQIAQIRVVGNRVVPETSILLQATTQRGAALSSRQLDLDKAKIDALGFFASVNYQVTQDLEDPAKVDVTFVVIENRVVTGFKFEGVTQVKVDDLVKILKTEKGAVLSRVTVSADVEAIQRFYRDKGFAAVVTESRQTEDGSVVFVVQEGRISSILLSGLKKTNPRLVRKMIRTKPGDAFDQKKIREDLNRIYDMNFFDDVSYKVGDDPDKPGFLIVTVVIKEKRTGQLSLGVGFDDRSKLSGFFSVGETNYKGTGKSVNAGIEVGAEQTFELGFANPYVGQNNASFSVSLFSRLEYLEPQAVTAGIPNPDTTVQYDEHRKGLDANYTLPLDKDRNNSALFGMRIEKARLFQEDVNGVATPVTSADSDLGSSGGVTSLSIGLLTDKRDLRIDPSSGSRAQIVLEHGFHILTGTSNFNKVDLDLRHYIPLIGSPKPDMLPRLVLAGRLVVGHAFGQLPAFEQYFIGGADTVRGYEDDQQFGDDQYYTNVELRYRLQKKFQLVAFTDSGKASGGQFHSADNSTLFSVGGGIRVTTPIGPIRLDVGWGKDGAHTSFAIGPTF